MKPTFKPHDIVKDKDGRSFRIDGKAKGVKNAYEVIPMTGNYGHTIRYESELTMVKEYVNKIWNNDTQEWEIKS